MKQPTAASHIQDEWLPSEIEVYRRMFVMRPEFQDQFATHGCIDAYQRMPAGSRFVNGGHWLISVADREGKM